VLRWRERPYTFESCLETLRDFHRKGFTRVSTVQVEEVEAIIRNLSPAQRHTPDTLNLTERQQLAVLCGLQEWVVERHIREYKRMQSSVEQLRGMSALKRLELMLDVSPAWRSLRVWLRGGSD
jgi:signal recognition particle GTPase